MVRVTVAGSHPAGNATRPRDRRGPEGSLSTEVDEVRRPGVAASLEDAPTAHRRVRGAEDRSAVTALGDRDGVAVGTDPVHVRDVVGVPLGDVADAGLLVDGEALGPGVRVPVRRVAEVAGVLDPVTREAVRGEVRAVVAPRVDGVVPRALAVVAEPLEAVLGRTGVALPAGGCRAAGDGPGDGGGAVDGDVGVAEHAHHR